jgi:CBS domain containing-hemolysin-like protein
MNLQIDFVFYVLSVAFLGIFSGAYVALEILSLSTSDRSAEDDDEDSEFVERLLGDPVHHNAALGIARALTLGWAIVMSIRVGHRFLFADSDRALLYTGLFATVSILVPVIVSKWIAVQHAERFAAATRVFTYPVARLLQPAAAAVQAMSRRISPGLPRLLAFRIIPLKHKIELFGSQNGSTPDEEQMLMSSILDFGETRVREIMVPRIDIVAVNLSMDVDEVIKVVMEAGHSRVPVYEDSVDKIVGTIYTKDLLRKTVEGESFALSDLVREAFFVPESKMIDDLLTEFRVRKQHLAIVVDEYGGTAGIITLEDVLEEIVGDIQDEFDIEEALVVRLDDDSAVCNAKIRLDELTDELGMAFPEDAPDSLGGLLYLMIGRVPRVGDKISVNDIEFEIQSVERQRIDKVVVRGLSSIGGRSDDDVGKVGDRR